MVALLGFCELFENAQLLTEADKSKISDALIRFNENDIKRVLLGHIEELKDILLEMNGNEVGNKQLIAIIEEQISMVYEQLSFFD